MDDALVPSEVQLEAWLTEYGDAVLRTCYLYLADRTLAEDALQDTFIKVWRGMNGRRGESSVKTWILRIAINTCKDYKRTAWLRHVDRSKPVEALPLSSADTTEESRELFDAVMRLPAKYKQAILLYHFHNLTMAETADVLKTSRSTVQNRLHKAYTLLEPEGSDE
ncbi:MAG TPA: sigma-70 family RNA polymerase sigma factor [Candidatus Limiplasma sp.]|nr:sigma-70 family RNA polymerase sigma factor [Candidatus Limiplasma sp.]